MLGFIVCEAFKVVEHVGGVAIIDSGRLLWQGLWVVLVLGLFRQHGSVDGLALFEVVEVVELVQLLRGLRFVAHNRIFCMLNLMALVFLLFQSILRDK
jgi:hypothetical protein